MEHLALAMKAKTQAKAAGTPPRIQVNARLESDVAGALSVSARAGGMSIQTAINDAIRHTLGMDDPDSLMRVRTLREAADRLNPKRNRPLPRGCRGVDPWNPLMLPIHSPRVKGIAIDSDVVLHALCKRDGLHAPPASGENALPLALAFA